MNINLDFGFDPFSFLVAVVALWFAIHESRRSNRVVVRIELVRCSYPQRIDENGGKQFTELHIRVRNLGISLHSPTLALSFLDPDYASTCAISITPQVEQTGTINEFARGMIAVFEAKSYRFTPDDGKFLKILRDPTRQEARLTLYSQGYLAAQFRIGGMRDGVAASWNRLARAINRKLDRPAGKTVEGHSITKPGELLPVAQTLEFPVMRFIDALK